MSLLESGHDDGYDENLDWMADGPWQTPDEELEEESLWMEEARGRYDD